MWISSEAARVNSETTDPAIVDKLESEVEELEQLLTRKKHPG